MVNEGIGSQQYYQQHYSSRDWRFYKSILSEVIRSTEPGPILDVGAGTGFIVEGFLRWGIDCRGIEGSKEAIDIARRRFPKTNLLQHFLSDPFPFPDQMFQTVIMNQVIEHLEPKLAENSVAESYRVLRPGGMLYVTSPSRFNRYERNADPTHLNLFSPGELGAMLSGKGFGKVIPRNTPLNLLGENSFGRAIMTYLFKYTAWERISATANCIAYK